MKITATSLSKRYTRQWIIRNFNYRFESNHIYGIIGNNGSGKSTLVKMISGYLSPTKGELNYSNNDHTIDRDDIYKHITIAAPYVNLLQNLTIRQMYDMYVRLKSLRVADFMLFKDVLQWTVPDTRIISELSSGQQQRLMLTIAILSTSDILLLDEPSSFLDEQAKIWFQELLQNNAENRIVMISSNDRADLIHCHEHIQIEDYH